MQLADGNYTQAEQAVHYGCRQPRDLVQGPSEARRRLSRVVPHVAIVDQRAFYPFRSSLFASRRPQPVPCHSRVIPAAPSCPLPYDIADSESGTKTIDFASTPVSAQHTINGRVRLLEMLRQFLYREELKITNATSNPTSRIRSTSISTADRRFFDERPVPNPPPPPPLPTYISIRRPTGAGACYVDRTRSREGPEIGPIQPNDKTT